MCKYFRGESENWLACAITKSGYIIGIQAGEDISDPSATFIVDINGEKKPNKHGRDIFRFALEPYEGGNSIMPQGYFTLKHYKKFNRNNILNGWASSSNYGCSEGKSKYFCALLIMFDGWQIKDDYPW